MFKYLIYDIQQLYLHFISKCVIQTLFKLLVHRSTYLSNIPVDIHNYIATYRVTLKDICVKDFQLVRLVVFIYIFYLKQNILKDKAVFGK